MGERVTPLPVDAADVTILVDSAIDILLPSDIVPEHCSGWKATHELSRQLPGAYVQPSVGTRLYLG